MRLKNNEVRIEVTNFCNGKCLFCPRDKMTRPLKTMETKHFKYLVDQCVELGAKIVSVFGFGEPLLDYDLERKIEYCSDLGLKTFITTNAYALKPGRAKSLIDSGLSYIRFSVHGMYDAYKKRHGRSYERTIKNILGFLDIASGICTTCVTSLIEDISESKEIINFWLDKVDNLEIWKPHNWAVSKKYRKITANRKRTCGRPDNGSIQILSNGKMIVCCFDINGVLEVGDTYKNSIENILKGKAYNKIREDHKKGNLSNYICDTCDQRNNETESPLIFSTIGNELNNNFLNRHKLVK